MKSPIKKIYLKVRSLGITPPWLVMCIDILVVALSVFLAMFIRDNFKFPSNLGYIDWINAPILILPVRILFLAIFQVNYQVIRYTSTRDVAKIFWACLGGSMAIVLINSVIYSVTGRFFVPNSVWMMEFFITTVLLIFYRFIFKILLEILSENN